MNTMPKKVQIAKFSKQKMNVLIFFLEIVNRNYFKVTLTPPTAKNNVPGLPWQLVTKVTGPLL